VKRYKDIAGDGGSNIAGQVRAQLARLERGLSGVRRVVAVVSGKGGVGKSSVTANLAVAFALSGWSVGILDADLNGPSIAKILGIRRRTLAVTPAGVEPPRTALGVKAMSMDLLLPSDATPLRWAASTQAESHTWRGAMEAGALREFLADTAWGALDLLLLDLPPGTDRVVTIAGLGPVLHGTVLVTIPSDVAHLVVKKSITAAKEIAAPVLGLVENMTGYACPDCGVVIRCSPDPVARRWRRSSTSRSWGASRSILAWRQPPTSARHSWPNTPEALPRLPWWLSRPLFVLRSTRRNPLATRDRTDIAPLSRSPRDSRREGLRAGHTRFELVVLHFEGLDEVVLVEGDSHLPDRRLTVPGLDTRPIGQGALGQPPGQELGGGALLDEDRDRLVDRPPAFDSRLLEPLEDDREPIHARVEHDVLASRHAAEQGNDVPRVHGGRAILKREASEDRRVVLLDVDVDRQVPVITRREVRRPVETDAVILPVLRPVDFHPRHAVVDAGVQSPELFRVLRGQGPTFRGRVKVRREHGVLGSDRRAGAGNGEESDQGERRTETAITVQGSVPSSR
jgi:ATP-binding protein involved in chromosome partitioning